MANPILLSAPALIGSGAGGIVRLTMMICSKDQSGDWAAK